MSDGTSSTVSSPLTSHSIDEQDTAKKPGRLRGRWSRFKAFVRSVPPCYSEQLMTRLQHDLGMLELEASTCTIDGSNEIVDEAQSCRQKMVGADPHAYPSFYSRYRELRLCMQIAVSKTASTGEGRLVQRIAADEASAGGQSAEAQALLRNLSQVPEEGEWSCGELRRILRCFWECDASSAIEQLDVHALTRLSITIVMGLFFLQYWVMSATTALTNIGADFSLAGIVSTLITALFAPVFAIEFQAGFFGMIGVILSFTLEGGFHPSTAHWRFVRNSSRSTRFMVGFLIGVLVARFLPFLVGPGEPFGMVGDSLSEAGARNAERFRIIFFAMVFGFSQDAFLKRILSVGQPTSAKTS